MFFRGRRFLIFNLFCISACGFLLAVEILIFDFSSKLMMGALGERKGCMSHFSSSVNCFLGSSVELDDIL